MRQNRLDLIGRWPIPGPEAREAKQMYVIKPHQTLDVIHGSNKHMLVSFGISNDFIHFGLMTIPGDVLTDPEVHKNGDEVFYVLDGSISVVITDDREKESLSKSRFDVGRGDRFLIPEGTYHRYLNLSREPVKLIFGVAPEL